MGRRARKKKHVDEAAAGTAAGEESVDIELPSRKDYEALEDKLKRALADMANMRRRNAGEVLRAGEAAVGRIVHEMLPIMDSFELALEADGDRDALLEGVRMVYTMLEDLLGRYGVEPFHPLDSTFDPQLHEALAVQQRDDVPSGTIVGVHQAGFMLGGRVLRPARVVVSQKADPEPPDDSAEPGNNS